MKGARVQCQEQKGHTTFSKKVPSRTLTAPAVKEIVGKLHFTDIENSKDQRSDRTDEDEEETFAVPIQKRTCGPKNSTNQSAGRGEAETRPWAGASRGTKRGREN